MAAISLTSRLSRGACSPSLCARPQLNATGRCTGVKHAGRVRMRHSVGDKLVYMHEALALRLKLQKAAYCEAAEKWDSDSDSDKSEDEEDLKM